MNADKYPLEVSFKKSKDMVYFSQIDLVHILERALRRSGLPLYFTQGFRPHVKISLLSGLKLGVRGKILVRFYFSHQISKHTLKEKLSKELPKGLKF